MTKDIKMEKEKQLQKIELAVDEGDFEIWIHDGHQKVEFYTLGEEEKKCVFDQIKQLEQNLEQFKSYTGYCLE